MQELGLELLGLSLMILVGKVLGDVTEKYGYGRITGELLGGMIMGPFALGDLINGLLNVKLFYLGSEVLFLSQLSVIFLVFVSGLEHGSAPLRRAGIWGALGAIMGALVPFALIVAIRGYLSLDLDVSMIVGSALASTSLAVVSGSLQSARVNGKWVDFLLSASAIDDVVSLILLSIAFGVSESHGTTLVGVIRVVAFYSVAWVIIFVTSIKVVPFLTSRVGGQYILEMSLVVLFGIIAIMQALGFSPIIAAFIAGVSLSEFSGSQRLQEFSRSFLLVFGSIFFVVVGAEFDLVTMGLTDLLASFIMIAAALIGKLAGVLPFAYAMTRNGKESVLAGTGMEPRGEVGLAIASAALQLGFIDQQCYSALTLSLMLTTILGLIAYSRAIRRL
ncbi:cation:proton antiporter [Acidilobus sp.]|uniref:cation:proton antiporter n=1 Tax=Acidilobus sp. TaxID=1872109 RepID=UPI003CFD03D1